MYRRISIWRVFSSGPIFEFFNTIRRKRPFTGMAESYWYAGSGRKIGHSRGRYVAAGIGPKAASFSRVYGCVALVTVK
jgi:hypothetical protein